MKEIFPWILLIAVFCYCQYRSRPKTQLRPDILKYLSDSSLLDLLNLGSIGVVISTPERVIIHASHSFCSLLGYNASEIEGKTWAELTHPKDQAPTQQFYLEFLSGIRASYRIQKGYQHKNGQRVEAEVIITCSRDASGAIAHIVAFVIDQSELHARQEGLEEALQKLEQASQDRMGFVASLSHEIRTPVNVVLGYCELLLREVQDAKHREYLQAALNSGRLVNQLVQDFMDLGKLEAGKLVLRSEAVALQAIITELVEAFAQRAQAKGLKLDLVILQPLVDTIYLDPQRLRQIVYNLLDNSLKFTQAGSVTLEVATVTTPSNQIELILQVRDTGPGVPAAQMVRIFEPYEQLVEQGTLNPNSSGLGLAVVRRLCELMGGGITVESMEGAGCQFRVNLPSASRPPQEVLWNNRNGLQATSELTRNS